MKRFFVLLAFLMIFTILPFTVNAENSADVVFSLSDVSGKPGDEVNLTLSVNSSVKVNSLALAHFEYDTTVLEFVGFSDYSEIEKISKLPPTYDKDRMAIAIALKKTEAHCLDLCTMTFKIKEDASAGTFSVGATTIVAKATSVVYTSALDLGNVTVLVPEPVEITGTSLVLDGSIGIKTYLKIDEKRVNVSSVDFQTELYDNGISAVIDTKSNTLSNGLIYDEEKGLYYVISYVAPKDADNREIRNTVEYIINGQKTTVELDAVNIPDYVETFKDLAAEDPNSEYGKALNLVNAIDAYSKYADNFFSDNAALENVTVDGNAINSITAPQIQGTASDIELYATSIILEAETTIRHYFKATDEALEKHTFKVGNTVLEPKRKYGTDYVYVDIKDISAQDMDESYVLWISDEFSVTYSVLNYVKLTASSSDAKLSNLVKALYNYYYQANLYAGN